MTTLFSIIAITAIWCLGIRIVTEEGMALHKWRVYAELQIKEGKIIFDPLVYCEWCMPSIHSIIGFLIAYAIGVITLDQWRLLFAYPIVVAGASFITGMSWLSYEYLHSQLKNSKNIEQLTHWDVKDRKKQHQQRNETPRDMRTRVATTQS